MNSFNSDYFIHGANVLLLLAYSVRDILWLRLFALASSGDCCLISSFSQHRRGRHSVGVPSLRRSISSSHGVFSSNVVRSN